MNIKAQHLKFGLKKFFYEGITETHTGDKIHVWRTANRKHMISLSEQENSLLYSQMSPEPNHNLMVKIGLLFYGENAELSFLSIDKEEGDNTYTCSIVERGPGQASIFEPV